MIRRPKPGDGEDEILQMQEEFVREKSKNQNHKPAAQVTNLRRMEPTKRASTGDSTGRQPSKYAQSKGLTNHHEKRSRSDESSSVSCVGEVLEKNTEDTPAINESIVDDDMVYFPKVIPSILGNIVEKNIDTEFNDDDFKLMPPGGFPVAVKHSVKVVAKSLPGKSSQMDIDMPGATTSQDNMDIDDSKGVNLPIKSFVVTSQDANDIHNENINILRKMSEKEILEEQQKLLLNLDPKLVQYLRDKRKSSHTDKQDVDQKTEEIETCQESECIKDDTLWENDILSHPQVNKWLHFNSLEKDKLEWMKGIQESKKIKPDEPFEARFDFTGYLLPYTLEYTEKTKTLFHHGEEPHRPGYSLSELIELSRSAVTQQRVMALNTIAGILEYNNTGTYKDVIEIPLSKLFFVVRYSMDENKNIILEPALKAMRNLLYNKIDEACLDALIGFEEGTQQPCLENDKSEIEELQSTESELKDFHLAEIDIIAALLRTNILQRLYYILETVKPSFNSVQYSMQIITRLARDSVETARCIVENNHLMRIIVSNFVPVAGINFQFDPSIVYNGKPILSALKLIRVLSLQSNEVGNILVTQHDIMKSISEYISSGVDGTYGLRIQIEAFCVLTNLLQYNVGIDSAISLYPVIVTALYKHVKGTDIFSKSSLISATHAAVVLQLINTFLNYTNLPNMDKYKEQIYPLLKEAIQKWITQLINSDNFTCGHLRLLCAALDCCKTVLVNENVTMKFLNDLLKELATSKGLREIIKHLVPSSNLLSDIENKDLYSMNNLKSLGTCVIDRTQKILPILNVQSPLPFLTALFKLLSLINDKLLTQLFVHNLTAYLEALVHKVPNLCDNWFTRLETDFLFYIIKTSITSDIPESSKDLVYSISNKLCYILRIDKKYELEYIFRNVVFNKHWFTAERLLNIVSLSDTKGFSKVLTSIDEIRLCYSKVINLNYTNSGPNVVLRKWQEPILPRDWIYLPVLTLYSKSQEIKPEVFGEHAKRVAALEASQKELIATCSLEWILFYESCFPDLLKDIDVTDRFCRVMCVFLCDNALFLDKNISVLLHKCTQLIFKEKAAFNFDKQLTGLNNFQDFYTQFLEQFQSVSYGDHTFAACVLVPLAQRHNVKWRKLLWSEYAGCLRVLDCPENVLCYDVNEYLYPDETEESLIKSYFQALSGNLLRPGTIAHRIARHHVDMYKKRTMK